MPLTKETATRFTKIQYALREISKALIEVQTKIGQAETGRINLLKQYAEADMDLENIKKGCETLKKSHNPRLDNERKKLQRRIALLAKSYKSVYDETLEYKRKIENLAKYIDKIRQNLGVALPVTIEHLAESLTKGETKKASDECIRTLAHLKTYSMIP